MEKDILIWGAGAIGGTVGAYLKRQGLDVTFVDVQREHVAAIRSAQHGLHISGPVADFTVHAEAFTPEELQGTWKRVFLCVKAQDTNVATRALCGFLAEDGYVLSLQNGLCERLIADTVGLRRTMGAFVNFGADWTGPGEILYGNRAAVVLGELDGAQTPRLATLHADLKHFEPDAIQTDDISSYLWGKLAYGSLLFAQSVGMDGIADCIARPELFALWQSLAREVLTVANVQGVSPRGFNGFEPAAFMPGVSEVATQRSIDAMVAFNRPNAKTHSGVWRDMAIRKRKTEVDMMLGEVVRLGAQHGVACPVTARLVAMIHEIEDGKRQQLNENLEELLP